MSTVIPEIPKVEQIILNVKSAYLISQALGLILEQILGSIKLTLHIVVLERLKGNNVLCFLD